MRKTVTAHTMVQNEENYIWFSVMSVIDYVDRVFVWSTGSTDKTAEIVKEIEKVRPGKVYFKEVGEVNPNQFTEIRQQMLKETESDWILIVDSDEVWWDAKINEVVTLIQNRGDKLDSIVTRYINLIGDIYHHQDDSAGQYQIDGETGYLTIRAMNRHIPGLRVSKPHGQQGFFGGNDLLIQNLDVKRREFIDGFTNLHFTNLPRSRDSYAPLVPKREMKYKYELGRTFPLDFYYPEVFFRPKPEIVPSPWVRRSNDYIFRAAIETPLKLIKRKVLPNKKSGY